MTLFGKFMKTESTNSFMVLIASWGSITEGNGFVD